MNGMYVGKRDLLGASAGRDGDTMDGTISATPSDQRRDLLDWGVISYNKSVPRLRTQHHAIIYTSGRSCYSMAPRLDR